MKEIEKQAIKEVVNKAGEKLLTAKVDFENKRYEDSISRAYYCIYHIISACLLVKGLTFSSHKEVIGNFNKEFIKTNIFPSHFSKSIKILFDDRQKSDYDVKSYIDKEKAEVDLKYTEELFNQIKNYIIEEL